jgi:hypothetical protein
MMLGSMTQPSNGKTQPMILASNTQQHKKKHKNKRKGQTKQTPRKGKQNIEK